MIGMRRSISIRRWTGAASVTGPFSKTAVSLPTIATPRSASQSPASRPGPGEAWLGFGPDAVPPGPRALSLSRAGDLIEAAANLFAHLRALDRAMGGKGTIAVAPVPETGLGAAINDRLHRAAAPREAPDGC